VACVLAALVPLVPGTRLATTAPDSFPGWPSTFEGKLLKRLSLSETEERFQQNFPGKIARFSDGEREIIFRWVSEGTRRLHPASDCFKANGFALVPQPIFLEGDARWSGFTATRNGRTLLVRERIVDGARGQWSDVSSWYWAVQLGQTTGPWWALTVASHR
jgi:hypothetical protein